MKKILLIALLFTGCLQHASAQTETTTIETTRTGPREKKIDQYVSVQLNSLIKQVFNFNNSAITDVNPYLLNYSINSRKTGWGIRLGAGYNYNSTYNNDGITETTNRVNDLKLRLGVEKIFRLSDKWSAAIGVDGLYNTNDDNTTSTVHSFDTVTTETKNIASSFGGGAMGWLRYHLTEHILIGTEASFYYVSGTQKQTVDITTTTVDPSGGGSSKSTTETISKPTISQGTFTSPIVFFITVKF